jgi:steroid delta-isomerase-like uncharacterized protein
MYRILPVLLLTAFFSLTTWADSDENIETAEAMVQAINERDLAGLEAYVAQDVVRHCAATPGVVVTNLDQFRDFLRQDFASVPDSEMHIDLIFGTEEYVGMRARYAGTQTGQMGPFPPSGKHFEIPFVGILRIEGGKIAEIWVEWDNVNALTQLGHLQPPSE